MGLTHSPSFIVFFIVFIAIIKYHFLFKYHFLLFS